MVQDKNTGNKNNIQMGIIIVLLVIIAVMGFFLGKNSATNNTSSITTNTNNANTNFTNTGKEVKYDELSITVIDDKRCTNCPTKEIINQLKLIPSVSGVEIITKDFSDEGVSDYLKENNIENLPLIVFSTNNFDVSKDPVQMGQDGNPIPKINSYLESMPSGEFMLATGVTFNPFQERSERGFLLLDKEKLQAVKNNSYTKGNPDAKITWIEYSDLECPFCAKLHNAGTPEDLADKYGDDLNVVFNHFPLQFHANAQPGAELLECLGEQKGSEAFYSLIKTSFTEEKSSKSFLIEEAVKLGADEDELKKCLSDGKYTTKVKTEMEVGTNLFGVTGTPGNILVNNETGEYEVISGAYPTSAFESIIDELLK